MTQTQMMGHLAEKIGISKKEAKLTLDELNSLVVRELKKEGSIRMAGLGIFRKRKLKARVGRNPATGEPGSKYGRRARQSDCGTPFPLRCRVRSRERALARRSD